MKCSIIIPVYNNANFTKLALNNLVLLGKDHEIIIVDNASEDHTFEVIQDINNRTLDEEEINSWVHYIANDVNTGFATANNQGYAQAKSEYVLFLNNDIRVQKEYSNWTERLMSFCEDDVIVGAQSGMIDSNYNFVKEGIFDPMEKGAYLSGWCMMAKKETWDKLILEDQKGPWNENFFLFFEDDDLSWRAKEAGLKLKIVEDLPVHHFSRTTGRKYNMFHFLKKSRRIFKKIWGGKVV